MADYSGTDISLPAIASGVLNSNRVGENIAFPGGLPLLRARVGGEYVYFTGTAPVGATDIVVVSPTGG